MNREQIAAIEKTMEDEHRKDLEALLRLKRFFPSAANTNGNSTQARAKPEKHNEPLFLALPAEGGAAPTIIGTMERILRADPQQEWTVPTMVARLEKSDTPVESKTREATVGLIFSKLVKRGKARLVRRGAGRIPNLYKGVPQKEGDVT